MYRAIQTHTRMRDCLSFTSPFLIHAKAHSYTYKYIRTNIHLRDTNASPLELDVFRRIFETRFFLNIHAL